MVIIRSHDALVRFVFGEPEQMAELLRAHLPPALVGAIRWPTLRRVEGTFVDKLLQERRADMLFEARLGDAAVLLHVLHEHKSEPDPFAALQMAGYAVRILEHWRAENHAAKTLPALLPVVLYHGDRPWLVPRCLGELFDLRGCSEHVVRFLRPLQLELRFFLVDLAAIDEPGIDCMRLSPVGALTLRFLQFLRNQGPEVVAACFLRWEQLVVQLLVHRRGKDVLAALFSWWLAGAPASSEALRTVMTKIEEENAPMRSLLDMVLDLGEERGVQRGVQQGLQQGQLAGRRSLLAELLTTRFGELPPDALGRVQSADAVTLQRWGTRLLSAPTLDAVFAAD